VAAERLGGRTVKNSDFTALVHASGAAREWEGICRREVATEERINTAREADGAARSSNISLSGDTTVEVVDFNVIVGLLAISKAEAELEHGRIRGLNTVLVDLDVRHLIKIILPAEHTRAGVEDTLDLEAGLHLLAKRSTIDDVDCIGILSVEGLTLSLVVHGHFSFTSLI